MEDKMIEFEKELFKQEAKRDFQQHMLEEHGEHLSLEEIEAHIVEVVPSCQCDAGLEEVGDKLRCPACGEIGVEA